jgi:hypothetical protein
MPNIDIDTQSAAYQNRHNQFRQIVGFWRPQLITYFSLSREQQLAWRAADPFLNDLLRFVKVTSTFRGEHIDDPA